MTDCVLREKDRDRPFAVEARLNEAFGTRTVHGWPTIPMYRPAWWQWRVRRLELRINDALATVGRGPVTEYMRRAYWREVRRGQGIYEDAGGYSWRCYAVMLGLDVDAPGPGYGDMRHKMIAGGGIYDD